LIGADISGEDGKTSQVRLQSCGTGAAIDEDNRPNSQVEDIQGHFQNAHVGIDSDQDYLFEGSSREVLAKRVG
jgi:hypothetical protein